MDEFLIFYGPFLLVFVSIGAAFWIAKEDRAVKEPHE